VDNITHSLFALTIANAGLRRAGRGATLALVVASNMPDIEIVTAVTGGRVGYLAAHRGPTHGAAGLLLALATGTLIWLGLRATSRKAQSASLPALVGLSMIGVAGHIAMDLATSYGTRILSPFSGLWFGVDWLPIADAYLWGILLAGIIATAMRPRLRQRIAVAVLLAACGEYGLRAYAHAEALQVAVAMQSEALHVHVDTPGLVFRYENPGRPSALPAVLPTFWSPFRWRAIIRVPGGYGVRMFDLRHTVDPEDVVFPDEQGPMVARAAAARLAQVFLDFSRFPAVDAIRHRNGEVTVHWYDLRSGERPTGITDGRNYTSPFAVWVRLSPDGTIVGQGLGPG
jgi:inner membrane protein